MKSIFVMLVVILSFNGGVLSAQENQYSEWKEYCATQPMALKPLTVGQNGPITLELVSDNFQEAAIEDGASMEQGTSMLNLIGITPYNFQQMLRFQNPYGNGGYLDFYQKSINFKDTSIITPNLFGAQVNNTTYIAMVEKYSPYSPEEVDDFYSDGEKYYYLFILDDSRQRLFQLPYPDRHINKVVFKENKIIMEQKIPADFFEDYYFYYVFDVKNLSTTIYQKVNQPVYSRLFF